MFQSTPPRGGRRYDGYGEGSTVVFQSTPPRGGRRREGAMNVCKMSFNPRPRAGGDIAAAGVRRQTAACFNPRPRAGGDMFMSQSNTMPICVSIHAPARGATSE